MCIPRDPAIGREAEVEWGNGTAVMNGVRRSITYCCMRSKSSGKHCVRCYPCERQHALFDAHLHLPVRCTQTGACEFVGGIFAVLISDHLTSAVRKVLRGKDREEHESFVKFRSYHSVEARVCHAGQGHEQGGVEGLIGSVRRHDLVPVPQAADFAELNQRLLEPCVRYGDHRIRGREQTVNALFSEERVHVLRLPEPRLSNVRTLSCTVDYCRSRRAKRQNVFCVY